MVRQNKKKRKRKKKTVWWEFVPTPTKMFIQVFLFSGYSSFAIILCLTSEIKIPTKMIKTSHPSQQWDWFRPIIHRHTVTGHSGMTLTRSSRSASLMQFFKEHYIHAMKEMSQWIQLVFFLSPSLLMWVPGWQNLTTVNIGVQCSAHKWVKSWHHSTCIETNAREFALLSPLTREHVCVSVRDGIYMACLQSPSRVPHTGHWKSLAMWFSH